MYPCAAWEQAPAVRCRHEEEGHASAPWAGRRGKQATSTRHHPTGFEWGARGGGLSVTSRARCVGSAPEPRVWAKCRGNGSATVGRISVLCLGLTTTAWLRVLDRNGLFCTFAFSWFYLLRIVQSYVNRVLCSMLMIMIILLSC